MKQNPLCCGRQMSTVSERLENLSEKCVFFDEDTGSYVQGIITEYHADTDSYLVVLGDLKPLTLEAQKVTIGTLEEIDNSYVLSKDPFEDEDDDWIDDEYDDDYDYEDPDEIDWDDDEDW